MPILAYCIVASSSAAVAPETGLRNAPLNEIEEEGLRAFYSEFAPSQKTAREDALGFFAVNRAIFREAAIIPFRFPTVLRGVDELRTHVVEHATHYATALQKLADLVQMEVRISAPEAGTAESGAEYMRGKQRRAKSLAQAAADAQLAAGEIVRDWRTREVGDGLRGYALVARGHAAEFARRVAPVEAPDGLKISVSGPWPATEFI